MSEKPQPGDTFSQLRELMLGDELEAIEALRSRLDGIETDSVERLAGDLAAGLRRRHEMGEKEFKAWVAELQGSTEAAIQRSVSKDKSRMSSILFPIMGPAIRDYMVDMFRRMAQELNETIRNTTSAKRIWWRVQARMAGKPYSEYVMLKTRAFRIEEVYLMQRDTGLLLLHAAANPEDEVDGEADLMSGMLTAIRSFVRDSFSEPESGEDEGESDELDGFTFGEREVVIEVGPSMALAAVAHGVPPPSLRDDLKAVVEEIHSEIGDQVDTFDGDIVRLEPSRPTLRRALIESRADAADSGGGMWRAWLFLGILLVGLGTWIFFGVREQRRWDRFEEALREEPGIAVTGVEPNGFWRHRLVTGLRDPDAAATPGEIAERFEIDLEKTAFEFDLMESLDPVIADRRRARAEEERRELAEKFDALKRSVEAAASGDSLSLLDSRLKAALESQTNQLKVALESLEDSEAERRFLAEQAQKTSLIVEGLIRSRFADVEGLTVESADGRLIFRGEVREPDYSSLLRQIAPISEVLAVDTEGLTDGTPGRIGELEKAIRETPVPFRSGSRDGEGIANLRQLADDMTELVRIGETVGSRYRFVVEAHPLIGTNREANRVIERTRLERAREVLTAGGIDASRIEFRLSEDSTKAGEGVSVSPVKEEIENR